MKRTATYLLLSLLGMGFNQAFSQDPTPLYASHYYNDQIDIVDTTGLSFTITGSITPTSDFGFVSGIYGMSLHPITEIMYVCYQSSGGAGARRLGTIDIGNAGNIIDMDFGPDGTLYGSTGNFVGYDFVTIDIATGASTYILSHTPSSYGGGMAYDPFADRMYYQNNNGTSFIDLSSFVETVGSPTGSPGETQAMVILTPTFGWTAFYGTLYSFNPVTEVFTNTGVGLSSYHAFAFGQAPCLTPEISASSLEECEGVEFTLSATAPGTLTWDGGVTDGVAFLPGTPGTYTYTVTSDDAGVCEEGASIDIIVVGLPTVIAGSGDLNYCEGESVTLSAAGDADEYTWSDADGGELDLNPGVGTHTYTLVGEYTEGGCIGGTSESTVDITVHPLPSISGSVSSDVICIGDSAIFTGSGGESYVWDTGVDDGAYYTPNGVGTVTATVIGTDANECSNSAEVDLEVVEGITLSATTVFAVGDDGEIDLTVSGGAPSFSFDWDNDGTGDFDDSEDLTGVPTGEYTVVVQSDAGCEATATFFVDSQLGVGELTNNVQVFPNPTSDNVNIIMSGNFVYELVAINGDILVTGTAVDNESISLKTFADGIYFINVKSDTYSTTTKVVKK